MYAIFVVLVLFFLLVAWKGVKLTLWRHKWTKKMPSTKHSFFNPLGDIRHIISLDQDTLHMKCFKLFKERFDLFKDKSLFCVWIAYTPFVMLIKADATKELLKGMKYNEKGWVYDFFTPMFGNGLLISKGEKWKMRRKLLSHCFHNDILLDFQEVFNENCQKLVEVLQAETKKEFTVVDNYMRLLALDMICETMFGAPIGALQNEESQYARAGMLIGEMLMSRIYKCWLWPNFSFKRTETGKVFYHSTKVLQDYTRAVIREKKANYVRNGETNGKRKRKAMMDMLLERHMEFQDMSEEDIREEVDTFIMEGHDTTASTMIFTLFLIGLYPEVQAKLQEELDRTFGKDANVPPSVDDLNNLKYMECVIKESNRIYTIIPIFGRQMYEDTDICGYTIPKGTACIVLSYYLHRDESVFPDPEKFDPDRFSPENAANIPEYAFLPFSAGPRNCIGKVYAMLEVKTILSYILRRFTLKSLDGTDKVQPVIHITLHNSIPVRIQFRNRPTDEI